MARLGFPVVLLALFSPAALAATFTVTKTSDTRDGRCDSDCSLREAVAAANASPGLDTLVLRAATYRLSIPTPQDSAGEDNERFDEDANLNGDLDVTDDLLVRGVRGYTAIDAGRIDRIFEVAEGVSAEFRDLELRNGWTPELGGALANHGATRLVRARLRLNLAASGFNLGRGGAVYNGGTLSVADSHFLYNEARGGEASSGEGGAIYNTGRLNVRTTRFIGNVTSDDNDIGGGGGIMNRGGFATVARAFFQGNGTSQHGSGGALANRAGGVLRLENSTVSGNSSGELSHGGGAVANGTRFGDAGRMTLNYVTIADNDGGGVFNAGEFIYYDSIIAGNYERDGLDPPRHDAGVNCVSLVFPFAAAGNVVGLDGENCRGQTYVDNARALSEVLHPLANNGGFAPSHALRGDFRGAIDAASQGAGACPSTDQRGAPRPADGDGDGVASCDVGAFERGDDD